MTALAVTPMYHDAEHSRVVSARRDWKWPIGVLSVGLVTGLLALIGLADGARSEYYAAIAKSMSMSWSNFFFGSFDPAGTVTLDKIPGSYWLPALSARMFGFSTWSIEFPNALAAAAAALFMAFAVKRLAGSWAGLFAGLIVGTTPILIAVSRSNQPESFFVLAIAFAFWAAVHAVSEAKLRWLVTAGVGIGLAFQCYMLEAWAFWPALTLAYLCTQQSWIRRIGHLLIAGITSLAVSLAWIIIVAAVPTTDRPYIGSTIHNSPWEMVFGYNGLGRFGATSGSTEYNSFTPPFSGSAGVLRLFNEQVAGQIAWLLPAALISIVVMVVLRVRLATTVLIGGTLLTYVAMFSLVAGMHQFYVAALALPISASVAVAFATARTKKAYWAQFTLLGVTGTTALVLSFVYLSYLPWAAWVQVILALGAIGLVVAEKFTVRVPSWLVGSSIIGAMLLTPFAWSVGTIGNSNSLNPVAGSAALSGMSGMGGPGQGAMGTSGGQGGFSGGPGQGVMSAPGQGAITGGTANSSMSQTGPNGSGGGSSSAGMGGGSQVDSTILNYLIANQGSAKYLFATFGAQSAASWITQTGASVLPIGGFSGSDNVPTLSQFQQLISNGDLKFVLMNQGGMGGGGMGGPQGSSSTTTASSEIQSWVQAHCTAVTADGISSGTLYQCSAS